MEGDAADQNCVESMSAASPEDAPVVRKPGMSDEERRQLAEKLDRELDEYIDSLERRPYTEGWPEDHWEEEMEKHPFFMTKAPTEGEDLPPLLEGIQQLKYDENENTPTELATTYKDDGNFYFKCKKYRLALVSYTEGLKQKCNDVELNAQLYNNRAATHFYLKNYRLCLCDCRLALKMKPFYVKVQMRAAKCCFMLSRFDDCIEQCDAILAADAKNVEARNQRTQAIVAKKKLERNVRKESTTERKQKEEDMKLLAAVRKRGISFEGHGETSELSLSALEPQSPENVHKRVHLEDGRLVWPVLFLYPEYKTTDFIQEFHEDATFQIHLNIMFETYPVWDVEQKYIPQNLRVYFEDLHTGAICHVPSKYSLCKALADKRYSVYGGTPAFLILVADSEVERRLLEF